MLDSCGTILDNTRRALTGLYHWAKFRWNRSRNFDKIEVWIFCTFGLKTLIHAPNCFFWGEGHLFNKMGCNINATHKGHILVWKQVIWHVDRQNWSNSCWDIAIIFIKMAAVRNLALVGHILERPMSTWRSLSLCKIWLGSL